MEKKVVLVTGGAKGIGAEIVRCFAEAGYIVVINCNKSKEKAQELKTELMDAGCEVAAFQADITDSLQVLAMVESVFDKYGRIDVLVNNAGIASQRLFTEITNSEWDQMFQVNVRGAFILTREVMRHMISEKRGKVINISSIWGMVGASCEVHYSASKAALIGMTKSLAKEVGLSGITVNCVAPGVIDTEMNGDLDEEALSFLKEETPLGRIGSSREVAELVLYLASEKGDFITGQVISPNGGFVI